MNIIESPWLSKLRFEPLTTGMFRGHYAVQGTLSPTSSGGTPEHRVNILEVLLKHPAYKFPRKIFRLTLDGAISEETTFRAISFCEALRGYGWEIQFVFDGFSIPDSALKDVLTGAQWIIIKTSANIVPYGSNELWYFPKVSETLKDPIIPPNRNTVLYLGVKDFEQTQIVEFLTRSVYDWNLLL
jgi:hypothetical protein